MQGCFTAVCSTDRRLFHILTYRTPVHYVPFYFFMIHFNNIFQYKPYLPLNLLSLSSFPLKIRMNLNRTYGHVTQCPAFKYSVVNNIFLFESRYRMVHFIERWRHSTDIKRFFFFLNRVSAGNPITKVTCRGIKTSCTFPSWLSVILQDLSINSCRVVGVLSGLIAKWPGY